MSALISLLKGCCPKCRKGKIFQPAFPLRNLMTMNQTCPHCGFKFEVEPGFFFGAMYISYAIVIGILLVGSYLIYHIFNDPNQWAYILPITAISVLIAPINFRISRIVYLYLFSGVKYKK
jgi:uncharacterized protein (DUF983 family)